MAHTEGKLTLHEKNMWFGDCQLTFQIWGNQHRLAFIEAQNVPAEQSKADAERLAACWNFCEGFATDALSETTLQQIRAEVETIRTDLSEIEDGTDRVLWIQEAVENADALLERLNATA